MNRGDVFRVIPTLALPTEDQQTKAQNTKRHSNAQWPCKNREPFVCWLSLKGNPYPKKGKKSTTGQQRAQSGNRTVLQGGGHGCKSDASLGDRAWLETAQRKQCLGPGGLVVLGLSASGPKQKSPTPPPHSKKTTNHTKTANKERNTPTDHKKRADRGPFPAGSRPLRARRQAGPQDAADLRLRGAPVAVGHHPLEGLESGKARRPRETFFSGAVGGWGGGGAIVGCYV